jgi:hypothetical protein
MSKLLHRTLREHQHWLGDHGDDTGHVIEVPSTAVFRSRWFSFGSTI